MKYLILSLLATVFFVSCQENLPRDPICDRAFSIYFQNHTILLEKLDNSGNDFFDNLKIDTSKIYIQRLENTGLLGVSRKMNSLKYQGINYLSFGAKREDCLYGDMNYKEVLTYPNGVKDTLNIVYLQGSEPSLAAKCFIKCSENGKFGAGLDIRRKEKSVLKSNDFIGFSEIKLIRL